MRTITKIRLKILGPVLLWVVLVIVLSYGLPGWLIVVAAALWFLWAISIRCPSCGAYAQNAGDVGPLSIRAIWVTRCAACGQDYRLK